MDVAATGSGGIAERCNSGRGGGDYGSGGADTSGGECLSKNENSDETSRGDCRWFR